MKLLTTLSLILTLLITHSLLAQTQIDNNIIPSTNAEGTGNNVAISADANRMLMGSRLANINGIDRAGAARVYQNNNGSWELMGQILEGENESQFFGETIAISANGNRIAIGTRDYLRTYTYNGDMWQQLGQDLTISNMSRTLELEFSSNGDILAAVFQQPTSDEFVQVYQLNGTTWEQMGMLPQPSGFDMSLSDSGTRIAMVFEDNDDEIKVFDFNNGSWEQIGQTIPPVTDYYPDNFTLSGDGNRLLIFSADLNGPDDNGFLSTYDLINGTWTLSVGQLDFLDQNPYRISLATSTDGSRIAIGTSDDNYFDDYNSVQVFEVINNIWEQAGDDIQIWSHDEQTPSVVSMTPDGSKVAMSSLLSSPGVEEGLIRAYDYIDVLKTRDFKILSDANVYPNPTKNLITIAFKEPQQQTKLTIINILGQIISSEIYYNSSLIITHITGTSGVYFATIETVRGTTFTRKIIKE